MAFIKAEKLKHKFVRRDEQGEIEDVTLALDDLNIEVEERPFTVDELINADEVIVSSSGDLCIRATEFEGKAVGKKDSDTFDRLKEYIYQEWLECTKK